MNKINPTDYNPTVFTFPAGDIDIDDILDSLEDVLGDDFQCEFDFQKNGDDNIESSVNLFNSDSTTTGIDLTIYNDGRGEVSIPTFAFLTDIEIAVEALKIISKMSPSAQFESVGEPGFVNSLWQKSRAAMAAQIELKDIMTVVKGDRIDYRILGNWLIKRYPEASMDELVDKTFDNFRLLVKADWEYGKLSSREVKTPEGEVCEVNVLKNGGGVLIDLDSLLLVTDDYAKLVSGEVLAKHSCEYLKYVAPATVILRKMPPRIWNKFCSEIPGEIVSRPKTFLLRWNPAISSFKMEYYINTRRKYGPDFGMDWSVWDYRQAFEGDRFYMLREGDGVNPGILFRGYFTSDPYPDRDWRGSDKRVYYVDIDCFDSVRPDGPAAIPTDVLDREIPQINWHIGHSGEVLPEEVAERLEKLFPKSSRHED